MKVPRKHKGRKVTHDQESRIVIMYTKGRLIREISDAVNLDKATVTKVLDAHGIRKPYAPAEAKKVKKPEPQGTIIQQCVASANERHKLLNQLFKPSKLA